MNEAPISKTINGYACTFCGCLCDDIVLTIGDGRVQAAENACALGIAGLTAPLPEEQPAAWICGQPAPFDDALARATELLRGARRPLIYGCVEATTDTQRAALMLAEQLGGVFDSPALGAAPLFPHVGSVTCSLGEAKNRADLIVLWSCDPSATHPRLLSHYLLDSPGRFCPNGRRDRSLLVVGDSSLFAGLSADLSFAMSAGNDFAAFRLLETLVRGNLVADAPVNGVSIDEWRALAERFQKCRFGVIVIPESLGPRAIEAAYGLVTELQTFTRFYVIVLRGSGNSMGVQNVVTWITGALPGPVSFHRGRPVAAGDEYRASRLLSRGEIDAALIVGGNPFDELGPTVAERLRRIPYIALSSRSTPVTQLAAVAFMTAVFPHGQAGSVFRQDGIALPLRLAIPSSAPSEFAVLNRIATRLRAATT